MSNDSRPTVNRRSVLKSSLAMLAGGAAGTDRRGCEPAIKNVNLASSPSSLEDHRHALCGDRQAGAEPVRSDSHRHQPGRLWPGRSARYRGSRSTRWCSRAASLVKILCSIDYLFQKIAQFGGNARQAGGVCAVEMALWDIAGKVYNIPVYQMLGGKWRDCDSHLRRHNGVDGPKGIRTARQRAQGDGPHLDEDGPGHQCA